MKPSLPPPPAISLPPPETTGGMPVMSALKLRISSRSFSPRPLTDAMLSRLLWAANGINRPETGQRTAPSACNWQEVDLYVIREDGAYRYDPQKHRLIGVVAGDLRPAAGVQAFVAKAPVVLAFVADLARMRGADADGRSFYPPCDTGYVSANVYLFCASEGLATVALVSVDKPALQKRLGPPLD